MGKAGQAWNGGLNAAGDHSALPRCYCPFVDELHTMLHTHLESGSTQYVTMPPCHALNLPTNRLAFVPTWSRALCGVQSSHPAQLLQPMHFIESI